MAEDEALDGQSPTRPAATASRLLARLAIVLGIVWACAVIAAGLASATWMIGWSDDQSWLLFRLPLMFLQVLWAAWPGFSAWSNGRQLILSPTPPLVRAVAGSLVVATAGTVAIAIITAMVWFGIGNWFAIVNVPIVSAMLGVFAFVFVCRQMLIHDEIPYEGWRDIVSQPVVAVASFLVGATVFVFIYAAIPFPRTNATGPLLIYAFVMIVPPLVLWFVAYQSAARWLGHTGPGNRNRAHDV
jgi:hypothetical protein